MYWGISVAHFCQRLIRGDSGGRRLFFSGGDRNDQQVSPCSNRDYFYTAESVLSRCVQRRISESTDWTPGVRGERPQSPEWTLQDPPTAILCCEEVCNALAWFKWCPFSVFYI
ncbi:hypothetical protein CDAR_495621 [Caerostris darwini]|uniref:Uncharacterized protein n=1 Tax=Caerostris darwini TaxID=1538125 RepID=A0AAV4S9B2_9ARAC|nr:hypothetical protein CDAR_495621 [Caerostris darwini]